MSNWYYEVNEYCLHLSECYDTPLIIVTGILSALSPNNTFATNIASLEKFLETDGQCKVSTFDSQKTKARQILCMTTPCELSIKRVLGGLKTKAFFENIYRPETSTAVTVDLWQIRWAKKLGIIPENGSLTKKRYGIISDAVTTMATKQNLLPHELQAQTWIEIRGDKY